VFTDGSQMTDDITTLRPQSRCRDSSAAIALTVAHSAPHSVLIAPRPATISLNETTNNTVSFWKIARIRDTLGSYFPYR
jgi:hypothetical protein